MNHHDRSPLGPVRPRRLLWSRLACCGALALAAACASDPPKEEPNAAMQQPSSELRASRRPESLELRAFQIGDRLLVVARGENSTGGYDTRFASTHGAGLELVNVPPDGPAIQMITSFELSGWLPADGTQQDVAIRVAGAEERVAVVRVARVQ